MNATCQPPICVLEDECGICMSPKDTWEIRHSSVEVCSLRTCEECWRRWAMLVIDKDYDTEYVECVCRSQKLSMRTIRALLLNADFERFSEKRSLESVKRMPDFVDCPNAECNYGHIQSASDDGLHWTCFVCGTSACASCRAPWHAGKTCEEYTSKTALHPAEIEIVEGGSKRPIKQCPSCKVDVQKADGCDHMTCRCGAEFCYICQAYYLSARTEGWTGIRAVRHKIECDRYQGDLKGNEVLGACWDDLLSAKATVDFGSKHTNEVIKYTTEGHTLIALYELGTAEGRR